MDLTNYTSQMGMYKCKCGSRNLVPDLSLMNDDSVALCLEIDRCGVCERG